MANMVEKCWETWFINFHYLMMWYFQYRYASGKLVWNIGMTIIFVTLWFKATKEFNMLLKETFFLWSFWKNFWFYLERNTLEGLVQGKKWWSCGHHSNLGFSKEIKYFKGLHQRKLNIKETYKRKVLNYSRLF